MLKKTIERWRKLSGKKVVVISCINLLVLISVFAFFGWFLNNYAVNAREEGFTYREVALCILFAFIINSFIVYKTIIKPLWGMEDLILYYAKNVLRNSEFEDLRIESALAYLLSQQGMIHERNKIEEKQRKKAELYALQSQINPHFLYNALDSIRGYALLHDMDEISEITEALSRVFRNMISDKHEMLSLRHEMDNISNYMKIQQFRFNNKFKYICDIPEEMLDKYMIPRMVLQPLVENAIMHGLEKKVDGGWVKITAYLTEKRFVIQVIDNGVGMNEERLEMLNQSMKNQPLGESMSENAQHAGIALININRRLKLVYGGIYGIVLSSTPGIRTTTEVVLPLVLNGK